MAHFARRNLGRDPHKDQVLNKPPSCDSFQSPSDEFTPPASMSIGAVEVGPLLPNTRAARARRHPGPNPCVFPGSLSASVLFCRPPV